MLIKRTIILSVVLLSVFTLNSFSDTERILVIYDIRNFYGSEMDNVSSIEEQFYHFDVEITEIKNNDYEIGNMSNYSTVVIISNSNNINNEFVISDLVDFNGKILWIGNGIEQLINKKDFDINYLGESLEFVKVKYKDNEYYLGEKREFSIIEIDKDNNNYEIYSSVSDGIADYPFILRTKNLYYVSRVDINEPLYYIFADVLFDVIDNNELNESNYFIIIDDVHMYRDYNLLKAYADLLHDNNIKFLIGLIPSYRSEKDGYVSYFSDFNEFIAIIKYMESNGGRVVLHSTLFNIYDDENNNEYETLNFLSNEENKIMNCLLININELIKNNIFPFGYQSSTINISPVFHKELSQKIGNFIGLLKMNSDNSLESVSPYILNNSKYFNRLFPLNTGKINSEDLSEFKRKIKILNIPRVNTIGVSFTSYLSIDVLNELIVILKEKKNIDIADFDTYLRFEGLKLDYNSEQRNVIIVEREGYESAKKRENFFSYFSWVVTVVLFLSLAGFVSIFIRIRNKTRDRMMKIEND